MNAEVQLQSTWRVMGLAQSGCDLSTGITSKWRSGMESAALDSQTWASELRTGSRVY